MSSFLLRRGQPASMLNPEARCFQPVAHLDPKAQSFQPVAKLDPKARKFQPIAKLDTKACKFQSVTKLDPKARWFQPVTPVLACKEHWRNSLLGRDDTPELARDSTSGSDLDTIMTDVMTPESSTRSLSLSTPWTPNDDLNKLIDIFNSLPGNKYR